MCHSSWLFPLEQVAPSKPHRLSSRFQTLRGISLYIRIVICIGENQVTLDLRYVLTMVFNLDCTLENIECSEENTVRLEKNNRTSKFLWGMSSH